MPMSDVLQSVACSKCGKQATKTLGQFAFVGQAREGVGDGLPPWESGDDGDFDGGHDHDWGGHGHSHGPGGHSHGGLDGLDGLDF